MMKSCFRIINFLDIGAAVGHTRFGFLRMWLWDSGMVQIRVTVRKHPFCSVGELMSEDLPNKSTQFLFACTNRLNELVHANSNELVCAWEC